jgi:glycyl-tRNA synthetase
MLIDASLIMNPKVWEASGHVGGFADPLMDCRECKARWRADKLVDNKIENGEAEPAGYAGDKTETARLDEIVVEM